MTFHVFVVDIIMFTKRFFCGFLTLHFLQEPSLLGDGWCNVG